MDTEFRMYKCQINVIVFPWTYVFGFNVDFLSADLWCDWLLKKSERKMSTYKAEMVYFRIFLPRRYDFRVSKKNKIFIKWQIPFLDLIPHCR